MIEAEEVGDGRVQVVDCRDIFCRLIAELLARALADDTPKTPEQIAAQQEIDKINADRALLEAQTAKFKAEQDADKARKQVEIDRITAEKALLEAQNAKSAAQDDNDKAKRQAEIDKLKAQKDLITVATPNITGTAKGTVSFDDKGS